jgi:hypothetical protein
MNGYVGDGKERTAFDEFVDSMPDVLPGCKIFKYGETKGQTTQKLADVIKQVEFDSQLHRRGFYNLGFNPDDVLFGGIAQEQQPVLSVVITDGVESDPQGQINTAVVDGIKSWMSQGKVFAILGLRSKFAGRLYSERERRMLDQAPVEARPFYAFVFSPSRREFDDLLERIRRRFGDVFTLLFTDDAVKASAELPTDSEASYAVESPPGKPYYWQMVTRRNMREGSGAGLIYKFIYEINPTYPLRELGLRVEPIFHQWNGKEFEEGKPGQPEGVSFEVADESQDSGGRVKTFLLKPTFAGEGQSDYSFYQINQQPYVKEIRDDVSSLSTRDDSTPANGGKTYRFQELVAALLDVHFKERIAPRVAPRLYLTVAHH